MSFQLQKNARFANIDALNAFANKMTINGNENLKFGDIRHG